MNKYYLCNTKYGEMLLLDEEIEKLHAQVISYVGEFEKAGDAFFSLIEKREEHGTHTN